MHCTHPNQNLKEKRDENKEIQHDEIPSERDLSIAQLEIVGGRILSDEKFHELPDEETSCEADHHDGVPFECRGD